MSESDLFDSLLEHVGKETDRKIANEKRALEKLESRVSRIREKGIENKKDLELIALGKIRMGTLNDVAEKRLDILAMIGNGAREGRIRIQMYLLGYSAASAQLGKHAQAGWLQEHGTSETQKSRAEQNRRYERVCLDLFHRVLADKKRLKREGARLSRRTQNAILRNYSMKGEGHIRNLKKKLSDAKKLVAAKLNATTPVNK